MVQKKRLTGGGAEDDGGRSWLVVEGGLVSCEERRLVTYHLLALKGLGFVRSKYEIRILLPQKLES